MATFHLYVLLFHAFLLKTLQAVISKDQLGKLVKKWTVSKDGTVATKHLESFKQSVATKAVDGGWKWDQLELSVEVYIKQPSMSKEEVEQPTYTYTLNVTGENQLTQDNVLSEPPNIFVKTQFYVKLKFSYEWGHTELSFKKGDTDVWVEGESTSKNYMADVVKTWAKDENDGGRKTIDSFNQWLVSEAFVDGWKWQHHQLAVNGVTGVYTLIVTREKTTHDHVLSEYPRVSVVSASRIKLKLSYEWGHTELPFKREGDTDVWVKEKSTSKNYMVDVVNTWTVEPKVGESDAIDKFKKWFVGQCIDGEWKEGHYIVTVEKVNQKGLNKIFDKIQRKTSSYKYHILNTNNNTKYELDKSPAILVDGESIKASFRYKNAEGVLKSVVVKNDNDATSKEEAGKKIVRQTSRP
eukprot:GHVS01012614.1.p1 GENE.GHVS01012614.1~~GHVS01012614.1.p1  ORF type:complete len:409 (+),score=33.59 GHVS01012614.1:93-1319(+)